MLGLGLRQWRKGKRKKGKKGWGGRGPPVGCGLVVVRCVGNDIDRHLLGFDDRKQSSNY